MHSLWTHLQLKCDKWQILNTRKQIKCLFGDAISQFKLQFHKARLFSSIQHGILICLFPLTGSPMSPFHSRKPIVDAVTWSQWALGTAYTIPQRRSFFWFLPAALSSVHWLLPLLISALCNSSNTGKSSGMPTIYPS